MLVAAMFVAQCLYNGTSVKKIYYALEIGWSNFPPFDLRCSIYERYCYAQKEVTPGARNRLRTNNT